MKPSRMKEDFCCFLELLHWLQSANIASTKSDELVPFSTGLVFADNRINTQNYKEKGMRIHDLLYGGNLTNKIGLKLKTKNFHNLKKVMKINNKKVILSHCLLFIRFSSIFQRNLTVAESLAYELTVFPVFSFTQSSTWGILIKQNWNDVSKIMLFHLQVARVTIYSSRMANPSNTLAIWKIVYWDCQKFQEPYQGLWETHNRHFRWFMKQAPRTTSINEEQKFQWMCWNSNNRTKAMFIIENEIPHQHNKQEPVYWISWKIPSFARD